MKLANTRIVQSAVEPVARPLVRALAHAGLLAATLGWPAAAAIRSEPQERTSATGAPLLYLAQINDGYGNIGRGQIASPPPTTPSSGTSQGGSGQSSGGAVSESGRTGRVPAAPKPAPVPDPRDSTR